MRDNLKEHIESNLGTFESYSFDVDNGWGEISGKLDSVEKRKNVWYFGIAAGLAILLMTTVLVLSTNKSSIPNEVAEMEGYYEEEINEKISLVKNQLGDDQILNDLDLMDEAFAELKADLKDNVDNEEVVMAMMDNYQLKLQVLEEILEALEKERIEESN